MHEVLQGTPVVLVEVENQNRQRSPRHWKVLRCPRQGLTTQLLVLVKHYLTRKVLLAISCKVEETTKLPVLDVVALEMDFSRLLDPFVHCLVHLAKALLLAGIQVREELRKDNIKFPL